MSAEITRPLTDEELLLGKATVVAFPVGPRLYDDWDWGAASEEETKREAAYLGERLAMLRGRRDRYLASATLTDADRVDQAHTDGELARIRGELKAMASAAARYRIPLPKED